MEFDETKENIQPLRGGRNAEHMEYVFVSPEQWEQERKAQEETIESYEGDDPLLPWYNYFLWVEQTNVSNFKPPVQEQALRRCVQLFENDPQYVQDHRFIKLCIKYIDSQPAPVDLFNELYNRGVGTLCAELYIAWAYYYDAVDNFAKTEEVFQKGLRAGAEPKAELEQAHKAFGFSMSQRLLHKDECSKIRFQTTLDERRNALTSLRTSRGKKHVGSVRTGLAVKSYKPGTVNQENMPRNGTGGGNGASSAIVYTDEPGSSDTASSIVRPFSSVHSEPENIIDAARLAKTNVPTNHRKLFGTHQTPSFDIPVDEEAFQPLPMLVDNSARGVVLPANFYHRNKPQTPFVVDICIGNQNERAIPMYDKIRLYCRAKGGKGHQDGKTEYSPEELRAYGYFVRHGVKNNFTREQALVWDRGSEVGIRLHPLHVPESKCSLSEQSSFPNPTLEECDFNIQTKVREMYSNSSEERSIEELLQDRWLKGQIKKCIDRRYQDDIDPVDMDETHVESKRISMGAARFSMAPPGWTTDVPAHSQLLQRKSIFSAQQQVSCINEETEEELCNRTAVTDGAVNEGVPSRKRLSNDVLEQEVSKKEDFTPTPLKNVAVANKHPSDEGSEQASRSINVPKNQSEKIEIFIDDSDDERETETGKMPEAPQSSCYPNDTCSTQMFNLFVKNISTPVAPIRKPNATATSALTTKRMVIFADEDEAEIDAPAIVAPQTAPVVENKAANAFLIPSAGMINDENAVPVMEPSTTPPSVSSGCNSTQSHKQLSTIMERTESSTASSSAAGVVTKSPVNAEVHSPDGITTTANDTRVLPETTTKCVFREPDEPARKSVFPLPGDDGKGFCIHIDSTETMANIPLKRVPQPATLTMPTDDKENELMTRATGASVPGAAALGARTGGVFQLSDEPTFSGYGVPVGVKNVSHMLQRELDANSIVSFRMGTERTNTVPLQFVKPMCAIPEVCTATVPAHSSAPIDGGVAPTAKETQCKNNSLLDFLDVTFSPKAVGNTDGSSNRNESDDQKVEGKEAEKRKDCSLNLSDLLNSPTAKASAAVPNINVLPDNRLSLLAPIAPLPLPPTGDLSLPATCPIKMEKSLNIDASIPLPNFVTPAPPLKTAPIERVLLDEFPSPLPPRDAGNRISLEEINTMAFSLNINHAVNSTIVQEDGFKTPSKQCPREDAKPQSPRQPFMIVDVQGGVAIPPNSTDDGFRKPALPLPSVSVVRQTEASTSPAEDERNEADVSIYHPRPVISQEVERWEEIEQYPDAGQQSNEYLLPKSIDMDATMQQINAHIATSDVDPFERQLLEAFLDRVDFLTYISELPSCQLVNVVHPLRKDLLVEMKKDDVAFRVQQKIGKGSYGTIYCATEEKTGNKVALKQERPANLWEYYICLELRSRIENPEILPGFMSIDYAIIGNNASIFVSPFSRYGTILDVCNMVNGATNRNMDEFIAMILTAQILSIMDHLHSCQIIHADIKPDNFLIMGPIQLNSKEPCIQLIDFGVSIDMKLFPEDTKFKKVITTDGFMCIEMLENKHWTYQPDLYGVAATSHVMLFGKYMQVQKNIVNYGIKTPMPRYFKKGVWENYFTTLLNIRDCEHLPNLQQLRTAFLEEITLHEKYIQSKIYEFNQLLATCK
uniref:Mitotic checkpoint serine/threonine-protein kinase BUB1 n=1 Tax=Anopheles farauti TaxID=69004 RepID=A0A182QID7_9DIPT